MKFKSLAMKLSLQHGSVPDYLLQRHQRISKAYVQQIITFSTASQNKVGFM